MAGGEPGLEREAGLFEDVLGLGAEGICIVGVLTRRCRYVFSALLNISVAGHSFFLPF